MTAGSDVTLAGGLALKNGAVMKLNGSKLDAKISIEEGAVLEGHGVIFTRNAQLEFSTWSGSTHSLLEKVSLTGTVYDAGIVNIGIKKLEGDVTLCRLADVDTRYQVSGYVATGQELEVEAGVALSGSVTVRDGATLRMNGARVEGNVSLVAGATWEGDGNVFASGAVVYLNGWSAVPQRQL